MLFPQVADEQTMKIGMTLPILLFFISCSNTPLRKPAQTMNGEEVDNLRVYLDFIETGFTEKKNNYDLNLVVFTTDEKLEDDLQGIEVLVDDVSVHWLKYRFNEKGDAVVDSKVPLKLYEKNTKIRVILKDGYKDFPLVCNRLGKCD
jgi:hypothetical protein